MNYNSRYKCLTKEQYGIHFIVFFFVFMLTFALQRIMWMMGFCQGLIFLYLIWGATMTKWKKQKRGKKK